MKRRRQREEGRGRVAVVRGVNDRAQLEKSKTRLCLNLPGRGAPTAASPTAKPSRGYRVSEVLPSGCGVRASSLDNRHSVGVGASAVPAVPKAVPVTTTPTVVPKPVPVTPTPTVVPKAVPVTPTPTVVPKPTLRSGGAVTVGEIRRSASQQVQSPVSPPRLTPTQSAQPTPSMQYAQPTPSMQYAQPAQSMQYAQPTPSMQYAQPAQPTTVQRPSVQPTLLPQARSSMTPQPRLSAVPVAPAPTMQPAGGANGPISQSEFMAVLKRLDMIEDRLTQLSVAFDRMSRCSSSSHESGREMDDVRKSLEVIKRRLGC